jgi:hypothetical protein
MVLAGSVKPPMVIIDSRRAGLRAAVGVQRAHRAVMTGVHGLQQVEGFRATHLTDDDPFGTHTQTVLDQVAHGDLALALEVGRAGFEAHDVGLLQLKFGGVLAGDDALVLVDIRGQTVEQRRLARTGTAGNTTLQRTRPMICRTVCAFRVIEPKLDQLIEGQLVLLELTNGQRGAVDGQRRRDHVDTRAVQQARVADRARFVDAAADLAHDALADIQQLALSRKRTPFLHLAVDFDEAHAGAVDHDVGDVVAASSGSSGP